MLPLVGLVVAGRLASGILLLYLSASLAAYVAYSRDKSAAQQHGRRTSERTLHLLGLLGGWPGALIARHVYHHKTRKQSFVAVFWVTVTLNCAGLLLVLSPFGQQVVTKVGLRVVGEVTTFLNAHASDSVNEEVRYQSNPFVQER
jgi:uncharacterized membrane protein YsdA (DUF1294 family)